MSDTPDSAPHLAGPGETVEEVVIKVRLVFNGESAGQFDDSCCYAIEQALKQYHGVRYVDTGTILSKLSPFPDAPIALK